MQTRSIGAETKAKLFRGFADPSRFAILESLREGARSVSEVVDATDLGQSNVSNHLACLLDCGLVVREPHGRFVYYRLAGEEVEALLRATDVLARSVAADVDACGNYRNERTA